MERETHNDIDQHIIDITTDNDSSSGSSLDEESYSSLASSLSTDESEDTICRGIFLDTMACVIFLVQIVAALLVLTHAKDEHPHPLLLTWLSGYTCFCITSTILSLSRCLRKYNQIGVYARTRMDGVMDALAVGIDFFFEAWFVLGILWIFNGHSSPSDAPKLYRLCVVFIVFGGIIYAIEVLSLIGERGLGGGSILHKPNHDDCCCICLVKYGEDLGVLKELECSHVFHSKCIDTWLRIKPKCPLCQSHVRG